MKKKYLFIPGAQKWNNLLRKFLNLHNRIKDGNSSEQQMSQMVCKLRRIYARLEKIQHHVGIKLAGSVIALMLLSSTGFSQDFTSIGSLTFMDDISVQFRTSPVFADIDKDGDFDLYVGNKAGFVQVFTNDGTGHFSAADTLQADGINIDVGEYSTPVFADVDKDGDLDLYVGNKAATVKVFTNNGTGTFSADGNLQASGVDLIGGAYSVPEFADIDGDNDLDLYVGNNAGTVKVFTNDGTGSFSAADDLQADGVDIYIGTMYSVPVFEDIDGDDDLDLYIGENYGQIQVYTNNGSGTFSAADNLQAGGINIDAGYASTLTFADIDDDGDLDLYAGEYYGSLKVYTNDGTGTFSADGDFQAVAGEIDVGSYSSPTFADIDEDGDFDLYVGAYSGYINVFVNDGSEMFTQGGYLQADGSDINVGPFSQPIFADLDKNNVYDLYVGWENGYINIYTNDGSGTFTADGIMQADGTDLKAGVNIKPEFADMDKDGDIDLFVGESNGLIKVFTNNGAGVFSSAPNLQADGSDIDVVYLSKPVFADLDGDSDLDLFVGEIEGKIQVFENGGAGIFSTSTGLTSGGNPLDAGDKSVPVFLNLDPCQINLYVGNKDGVIKKYEGKEIVRPVITSTHTNQTIDADSNCETLLPDYTGSVTATDNCHTDLTIEQLPVDGTTISGTTNSVTLTVTDDAGNYDEVTFNVAVEDNTDPEITSTHDDIHFYAGVSCGITLPNYTTDVIATDNCDSDLDIKQSPVGGTTVEGAINTITLTATDDAGNYAEVTFNVEVEDNINPVITSTHTGESVAAGSDCNGTLPDYTGDVTARDNCDDELDITQSPASSTSINGSANLVTLTATDDAGNSAEITFNVEVTDETDPVVTCVADATVTAGTDGNYTVSGTEYDATVTDNCYAIVTNDLNSNSTLNGEILSVGTHTIVWTAADNGRNTATCSMILTVQAGATGIYDLLEHGIKIYPNPVRDYIVIDIKDISIIKEISLFDLVGRRLYVHEGQIRNQLQLNMSNYSEGFYFLNIKTEKSTITQKIIKK